MGAAYRQRPVSFWDLEYEDFNGQFRRLPYTPPEPLIHGFLFNPNPDIALAVVAYQDGEVVVFDPVSQQIQARAYAHALSIAVSPDGTVLACDIGSGAIKLYDFETMRLLYEITSEEYNIRAMTFSKSGHRILDIRGDYCNIWEPSVLVRQSVSGDDSSVDLSSDTIIETPRLAVPVFFGDDLGITALRPHQSHDVIFCGREDGSVAIYSGKTGHVLQELYKHDLGTGILLLEWSEAGQFISSVDRSGRIIIRRVTSIGPEKYTIHDAMVDRRISITRQILTNPSGKLVLLSTIERIEVLHLDNLDKVTTSTSFLLDESSKWMNHPTDPGCLILFRGTMAKLYNWSDLSELSSIRILNPTQEADLVDAISPTQSHHIFTRFATSNGSPSVPSIQIIPKSLLSTASNASSSSTSHSMPSTSFDSDPHQYDMLSREIKVVLGTYRSWLVFLNHSGWVCSINLDTATRGIGFYTRHFFVPLQWHRAPRDMSAAVTRSGAIVMAVDDEIVVFHNGLDFEESVPIKEDKEGGKELTRWATGRPEGT